jgi:hypothetical protein
MGYFRRPTRRGAARHAVRTTLYATRLCGAGADAAVAHSPRAQRLYLRFSAGAMHPDSHKQKGVFHASNALHEHGRLTDAGWDMLRESQLWFNENLVVPNLNEGRAIFWFRADARACLRRIWDQVTLLRDSGIPVCMLRCTDPGLIVYHDELQIAAIPQRRVRWRQRML